MHSYKVKAKYRNPELSKLWIKKRINARGAIHIKEIMKNRGIKEITARKYLCEVNQEEGYHLERWPWDGWWIRPGYEWNKWEQRFVSGFGDDLYMATLFQRGLRKMK